ncbi:metal-dependent hydrolase [Ardenticatena maritima]|uniref:Metal-dependent hydrolase n=1 Tax=Ardenticatena maritima TaxID=872965 RepID=A0A0N8GSH7_9CHLR|nr:metal-dependent hydrolase [Ardenticatena maritima]KPL89330.1 hypothetical protein SE16_02370 [Ardenticatena maritima]
MLPFGHVGAGLLWGRWIAPRVRHLSAAEVRRLGGLGGVLPDIDLPVGLLWYWWRERRIEIRHHQWPTHTPLFHLAWLVLGYTWATLRRNRALQERILVLGGAACLHIVQDVVGTGDGVQLFYPLSRRHLGVGLFNCHGRDWLRGYVRSAFFWCELVFGLLGLIVWRWPQKYDKERVLFGDGEGFSYHTGASPKM